jgi:hypothetical protein
MPKGQPFLYSVIIHLFKTDIFLVNRLAMVIGTFLWAWNKPYSKFANTLKSDLFAHPWNIHRLISWQLFKKCNVSYSYFVYSGLYFNVSEMYFFSYFTMNCRVVKIEASYSPDCGLVTGNGILHNWPGMFWNGERIHHRSGSELSQSCLPLLQESAWTVTKVTSSQCSYIHLWVWRWEVYFSMIAIKSPKSPVLSF